MQKLVSPFSMEHRAAHARESHQRRRLHGGWPTGTYGASTGSCRLPIGNSLDPNASSGGSDFPTGTGPQPGKTINLVLCDFDRTKNTLTVFDGTTTLTGVPQ